MCLIQLGIAKGLVSGHPGRDSGPRMISAGKAAARTQSRSTDAFRPPARPASSPRGTYIPSPRGTYIPSPRRAHFPGLPELSSKIIQFHPLATAVLLRKYRIPLRVSNERLLVPRARPKNQSISHTSVILIAFGQLCPFPAIGVMREHLDGRSFQKQMTMSWYRWTWLMTRGLPMAKTLMKRGYL
jgi:hypothetical protein